MATNKAKKAKKPSSENTINEMEQTKLNQDRAIAELKTLYNERLHAIEKATLFNKFHFPEKIEAEFNAKPTILLVGQYSTGKTSFIKQLIGQEYPDSHIGPEPTTDKFVAVVYGEDNKIVNGNAVTSVEDLPFGGLSVFGNTFLSKFSASYTNSELLKTFNLIDTPGVLSGEKQRTSRGYDFGKVCRWFAERSDLILLMFDCSKLDISDEFKSVIEELQPHENKVHCILNKADQLDQEMLMRVYGALLWSMGRIFKGAEVSRIYVGSFRDEPLIHKEHAPLFEKDKRVLMDHLQRLPGAASMRQIDETVKRIRLTIVHSCILGQLRSQMPYLWGKESAQKRLINNLKDTYDLVRRDYQLAEGDFPNMKEMQEHLVSADFYKFPRTDRKVLSDLKDMMSVDIPRITALVAGGRKVDDEDSGDEGTKKLKKLPSLFIIDERTGHDSKFTIIVAVVSVLVLILSLFLVSSLDDHAQFIVVLNKVMKQINA